MHMVSRLGIANKYVWRPNIWKAILLLSLLFFKCHCQDRFRDLVSLEAVATALYSLSQNRDAMPQTRRAQKFQLAQQFRLIACGCLECCAETGPQAQLERVPWSINNVCLRTSSRKWRYKCHIIALPVLRVLGSANSGLPASLIRLCFILIVVPWKF